MQETAYEVLLQNQRIELHVSCAKFLEDQTYKCPSCGGGDFVPPTHLQNTATGKGARPKSGRLTTTHRPNRMQENYVPKSDHSSRKTRHNVTFTGETEVIEESGEALTSLAEGILN